MGCQNQHSGIKHLSDCKLAQLQAILWHFLWQRPRTEVFKFWQPVHHPTVPLVRSGVFAKHIEDDVPHLLVWDHLVLLHLLQEGGGALLLLGIVEEVRLQPVLWDHFPFWENLHKFLIASKVPATWH